MDTTQGESILSRQRLLHRVLIVIFLSTLPCYCAGIVTLVAFAPGEADAGPATPPPFIASVTATLTPVFTATSTVTPGGPTLTLFPTPSQFVPPPTKTPTPTATNTPLPTDTALPTSTDEPTKTPKPTKTDAPATETDEPTPTETEDPDTDSDGLPDAWELTYFADLSWGADDDPDGDTLLNQGEFDEDTDPSDDDSDDDGLIDGDEVFSYSTDPLKADTDDGGEDDGSEVAAGRDPLDDSDDVPP
jgi:hypothetical protein